MEFRHEPLGIELAKYNYMGISPPIIGLNHRKLEIYWKSTLRALLNKRLWIGDDWGTLRQFGELTHCQKHNSLQKLPSGSLTDS